MTRTSIVLSLAAPLALFAGACTNAFGTSGTTTPKYPLQTASTNPAAQGTVSAQAGQNGNTQLSIEVKHLAPPGSIAQGATTYVAWIVPSDAQASPSGPSGMAPQSQPGQQGSETTQQGQTQNFQGQEQFQAQPRQGNTMAQPINVGAIQLDSDLHGRLDSVTPFHHFELIITPEPNAQQTQPTNEPVLMTRIN